MDRSTAWGIVTEHVAAAGLRRHMLAVEATMRFYADRLGEDPDLWGLAGLLHDYDWEIHPTLEAHPQAGIALLAEAGAPEPVLQAILAHNEEATGVSRRAPIDFGLLACNEVTGLVIAAALVRPSKDVREVEVKSIQKRWKERSFAAGVDRPHVESATADFNAACFAGGLDLWQHVANVLAAMKGAAAERSRRADGEAGLRLRVAISLAAAVAVAVAGVLVGYPAARASFAAGLERLPVGSVGVSSASEAGGAPAPPALAHGPVRNVVLLVGDGMGLAQIAAGRIAAYGPEGRFHFERLPTIGLMTTHAAGDLIAMSDAAATALATGVKTRNRRIGVDPAGRPLPTLLETLRDAGWVTGLVTTTRITDATPASFATHVAERRDEAGIALQLSAARVDLLAGGGRRFFLPRWAIGGGRSDGRDLAAELQARGVEVVADAAGLAAVVHLPVAALFAVEPQESEPRSPTLEAMANKALALLAGSGKPFFLLLEEEEIDTAAHAHDGMRMSAALRRFDAAVTAAVDFAARDGATLVLVLGDHATGGLTIDSRSSGTEMALHWATAKHSGEPVPIFAYGPPAAMVRFAGMHDNTEIPRLVTAALGVEFPPPESIAKVPMEER